MKYKINIQNIVLIQFILGFIIIAGNIFGKPVIVSLCFNFTFIILAFLLFLILFEYKFSKKQLITLGILYTIIIITFAGVAYGSNTLSFGYYKKMIMFYSTIIFLFIMMKVNVNRKIISFIITNNILLGVLYILGYYTVSRRYFAGGLSFHYTNPNLAAMWLLHTAMYCIIGFIYNDKKIKKIWALIVFCYIANFIIKTESRTSLIALCIFLILVIFIRMRKEIKIPKSIVNMMILSPIIIVIVYMGSIESGFINEFEFMESEGKSVYSREKVWNHAINEFKLRPILGNYNGISQGTGMSQMHNTHLDILASYGIIVFIVTMIYIMIIVNDINKVCRTKLQLIGLTAFLTIIVMGFGEAALFSGGVGMYILSGGYLLIARYNDFDEHKILIKEKY